MRDFHTRVLVINYSSDEIPKFATDKEHQAWLVAVGRMVVYGMGDKNDGEVDSIDLVRGGFGKNPLEFCCTYSRSLPMYGKDSEGWSVVAGSEWERLSNFESGFLDAARKLGHGFTIGAVLHSDGEWGFHS
jgi:hypothetical protein